MLKVLIADDEPRVGRLIRQLIHWEQLGLEPAGLYLDGQSALEAIQSQKPDIVITDIRMPVLTGLELIRLARQQSPHTRFVVVSGYRYFEYAQKALKYGVEDYLLKPIDEDELNRVLAGICGKTQQLAGEKARMEQMESSFHNSRRLLFQRLMQLLRGDGPLPEPEALQRQYGVTLAGEYFVAACLKADRDLNGERSEERERLLADRLWRMADETLTGGEAVYSVEGLTLQVLISYAAPQKNDVHQALHQLLTVCRNYVNDFGGYTVSMGMSADAAGFSGCRALLTQAARALDRRLFEGAGLRLKSLPEEAEGGDMEALWREASETLKHHLDAMQAEPLQRTLNGMFARAQRDRLCAWQFYQLAERAATLFAQWADQRGLQPEPTLAARLCEECRNCVSVTMLREHVSRTLAGEMQRLYRARMQAEDRPIAMAMEYIRAHYAEKITLEQVAGQCGFNPTYYSEIFKRRTGKNFSDYLTEVRIEAAKGLLRDTRRTIYEVAEAVGYKDAKYFSQQFVKCVGIKPTEYRRLYY